PMLPVTRRPCPGARCGARERSSLRPPGPAEVIRANVPAAVDLACGQPGAGRCRAAARLPAELAGARSVPLLPRHRDRDRRGAPGRRSEGRVPGMVLLDRAAWLPGRAAARTPGASDGTAPTDLGRRRPRTRRGGGDPTSSSDRIELMV